MYNLTHDIVIGTKKLLKVERVKVVKSLDSLTDTATITVAGMSKRNALEVEKNVKRGLAVSISLGYDGDNKQELVGYVKSVSTNNSITIECEDRMFEFHKEVPPIKLKDVSLVDIIHTLFKTVTGYTLAAGEGVDKIRFSEYTIAHGATAFQVLGKLKSKSGVSIYLRENVLHVQLRFLTDKGDKVHYDFTKNIEKSQLAYVKASEIPVFIELTSILKDGTKITKTAGVSGGDKLSFKTYNVSDPESVQQMADEYYKKKAYTGMQGKITTWLLPFATVGDKAVLKSENYAERQGTFLIQDETLNFSKNGGKRELGLTVKLD